MTDVEVKATMMLRKWFNADWAPVFERFGLVLDFTQPADVIRAQLQQPLPPFDRHDPLIDDLAPDARSALCRSDPAKSLVYHVWASAHHDAVRDRPSLAELDLLENYIYALGEDDPLPEEPLVAMVLAYAYRHRAATPHRLHADMVYSRVAVTRVGTRDARYGPANQAWEYWAGDGFRVTRARLGVFLCRAVKGERDNLSILAAVPDDHEKEFVLPVRKLFTGARYPGHPKVESIAFRSYFLGDKLKRIIDVTGAKVPAPLDTSRAPFVNVSRLETATGSDCDDAHVELNALDGACLVGPRPRAALISVAMQGQHIARFKVPPREGPPASLKGHGIDAGNLGLNRHYTSLLVASSKTRFALETVLGELEHVLPSVLDPLPKIRPRAAPEFVNIRHRVESDGRISVLGNALPDDNYEAQIDAGGYEAAMFEDGIMDGAVWAVVDGTPCRAAFVLVTAPDFFPRADEADLEAWTEARTSRTAWHRFNERGPTPLCSGRLAPNLTLTDPWTGNAIFATTDNTATALVSRPVRLAAGERVTSKLAPFRHHPTGFLSDCAPDEFAPGWDVSYDELDGAFYYTTHGLGSPYPEDVKFCASANAYWPAASPGAARTFDRPGIPTAIPMLDDEIGFHPDSPFGTDEAKPGWDGEFGPFFQTRNGDAGVNFADIRRSDYVYNATQRTFASRVFALTSEELIRRTEALRACLDVVPKAKSKTPSETRYWIISATSRIEAQDPQAETADYSFELCVPTDAHPQPMLSRKVTRTGTPGYWRLWRPVGERIVAECYFDGPHSLVPQTVRYAAFDNTTGAYGDWQLHRVS